MELGSKLGINDFGYSRGWLYRFKSRHQIKKQNYQGEAASADKNAVVKGREELKSVLKNYDEDDIFNLDETGLFYKLGPNHTLASKKTPGVKKSKERVTVALCCNATGTIKVKPFMIGKFRRPHCFGKDFNPEIYARYRFNKKAWMTSDMFCDWLRTFDRQYVSCQTIKNCFKHVEILPSQESQIGETDDFEDDIVLADLKKLLQRLPSDDENMSPDDFIDADANEETCDSLTSENIIEIGDSCR
ncbi:tigger transposable element-derived protein 6-like [Haliotis rubra]|uniref:tigger transposable element-derived protein 6-like n=1 Tax=Haliotis rubra TaxID=36100 RepID=UPI001EE53BC2|nr:tigger transposable element-derived protein 6-like [Haliotis rubra]